MQSYKSAKNIEIDRRVARRQDKQRGEMSFELEPNSSGLITTPFVKTYADVPFIIITPIVGDGHEFDITVAVTNITKKDFTINVQSVSEDVVKGAVQWYSE